MILKHLGQQILMEFLMTTTMSQNTLAVMEHCVITGTISQLMVLEILVIQKFRM